MPKSISDSKMKAFSGYFDKEGVIVTTLLSTKEIENWVVANIGNRLSPNSKKIIGSYNEKNIFTSDNWQISFNEIIDSDKISIYLLRNGQVPISKDYRNPPKELNIKSVRNNSYAPTIAKQIRIGKINCLDKLANTKNDYFENKNRESQCEDDENYSFAYENDLKNFLVKNISIIENGLKLYENGVEYPVGGKFIDILAEDINKNFVVIELKVSKGYDRVIGQILRYMAWIKKNLASIEQKVRGIIIAKEITEDLKLAAQDIPDVELFEYELSISLIKK